MASFPTPKIEVAFANNPGDSSLTWTDISAYVDAASGKTGRQNDLDKIEAGTATLILHNDDRRFDPTYTAGPYYGQLLPNKRIRVTASWDAGAGAVVYPVFSGLVEGWPQSYSDGGYRSLVSLSCSDLFRSLANADITDTYSATATGARVNAVLNDLGWPAGDRDIDTGQSTIQAVTLTAESGLPHLQDVANSENGLLFMSRDGKVTFIDRASLILAALDTSLVWGEAAGEYPYTSVTLAPDDSNLYNDVTVTAPGLTDAPAQSSTSITKYLKRSLSRATLLDTTGQMTDLAHFLVSRFSEPATRIVSMQVNGQPSTTLPFILAREIGDKIVVRRRPNVGTLIQQDSVIESRAFAFDADGWEWAFDLSPIDSISNYWVLGDATQSLLGSSTNLAY